MLKLLLNSGRVVPLEHGYGDVFELVKIDRRMGDNDATFRKALSAKIGLDVLALNPAMVGMLMVLHGFAKVKETEMSGTVTQIVNNAKLKELRLQRKMTLVETAWMLALYTGVVYHFTTVSTHEAGTRAPDAATVKAYADIYKVQTSDLYLKD